MSFVRQISIRSRLIIMLFLVSGISILAVAWVGYETGRESLTERIYQQLLSLREDKSRQVELYLNTAHAETRILSQDPTFAQAIRDFRKAYTDLDQKLAKEGGKIFAKGQRDQLETYYTDTYLKQLAEVTGQVPGLQAYLPRNRASQYLQYHYLVNAPKQTGETHSVKTAGDGSQYSQTHAKYNDLFRHIVEEFNYSNLFLIDAETGLILYSVFKNPDFATQFRTGPYTTSNLAEAFDTASRGKVGSVTVTDFELYDPILEAPTAFMAAPITDETGTVGVVAIEVSTDQINRIMTSGFAWEESGLGKTGEVYLVGPDATMRSTSRFLVQDPQAYYEDLKEMEIDQETLDRIQHHETSILLQKTSADVTEQALAGKSGTQILNDYRGLPVLASYAPLPLFNLNWSVVAEMELSEAYLPIREFERRVIITSTLILLLVSISTVSLGYLLVRPITDLKKQMQEVRKGNWDQKIATDTKDEVGELSKSIQKIVDQFQEQSQQLEQKDEKFHKLLTQVFPNAIANRLEEGETEIAETVEEVTILLADTTGFLDLSSTMSAEESLELLNQLFSRFDKVAERFGAEKLRTVGDHYMLTCGLTTPHLDHDRRIVDCGVEMLKAVRRLSAERDIDLDLAIGIDSGSVTAGFVGGRKITFDVFGKAVNHTSQLMLSCPPGYLQVSHQVYKRLHDLYDFSPIQEVRTCELKQNAPKIWQLQRVVSAPETEAQAQSQAQSQEQAQAQSQSPAQSPAITPAEQKPTAA